MVQFFIGLIIGVWFGFLWCALPNDRHDRR